MARLLPLDVTRSRSHAILWDDLSWTRGIDFAVFVPFERFTIRCALLDILWSRGEWRDVRQLAAFPYRFHGRTHNPQHFSRPSRFFSASRIAALIRSMPESMASSCSKDRLIQFEKFSSLSPWAMHGEEIESPTSLFIEHDQRSNTGFFTLGEHRVIDGWMQDRSDLPPRSSQAYAESIPVTRWTKRENISRLLMQLHSFKRRGGEISCVWVASMSLPHEWPDRRPGELVLPRSVTSVVHCDPLSSSLRQTVRPWWASLTRTGRVFTC